MNELKRIFCRYDMVCDNPSGAGMELYRMPEFFENLRGWKPTECTCMAFMR